MRESLAAVQRTEMEVEAYLASIGTVFRAFRNQDSGCISLGVESEGRKWFVKYTEQERAFPSLERARRLHSEFRHPALPRLHNAFGSPGGRALVYDWVEGEVLYAGGGSQARNGPAAAGARFRALPVPEICRCLDLIFSLHLQLADRCYIAVDLYDGCFLYDFQRREMHLCDLDEYRPGPFTLEAERLPGSTRFMAPEEFQRGALIDQRTNVYNLAKTALVLLGDGSGARESWRGGKARGAVLERATQPAKEQRYPTVRHFVTAWDAAC